MARISLHPWRIIPADRRGIATAELAVIFVVILAFLFGIFDLGLWVWQRMQLQAALTSGVVYAQVFPTQYAGICASISGSLPPSFTNATTSISVLGGAAVNFSSSGCSASGGGDGTPGLQLTITVSYPFSPLYLTAITTNQATHVFRIQ
jgi:Flp pilus assembly protein TadG